MAYVEIGFNTVSRTLYLRAVDDDGILKDYNPDIDAEEFQERAKGILNMARLSAQQGIDPSDADAVLAHKRAKMVGRPVTASEIREALGDSN